MMDIKFSTERPLGSAIFALVLIALFAYPFNRSESNSSEVVTVAGIALAPVPAGTFTMGSPGGDAAGEADEVERRVTISKSFYLGVYEVTQAQYESIMGVNPSKVRGPNLPVEHVTWHDAVAFCEKLNATQSQWRFRLPTEAEWEYACRAGTTTRYYWGTDPDHAMIGDFAYCKSNSGGAINPVGGKKPNAWGLHDMSGNVWEWCQDWMGPYDADSASDPQGPPEGSGKVCRGGCWAYDANRCRSAERNDAPADSVHVNLGFRVLAQRVGK